MIDGHPLDNPVQSSLLGPHAQFAERRGSALRYPTDVCPFIAIADGADSSVWADVRVMAGPGAVVVLAGVTVPPPIEWEVVMDIPGVQLAGESVRGAADVEAVRLTPADVPDMLALVDRTRPGPFLPQTIQMGDYLGIRRDGVLVAMAGERFHPPGWTEISAVCTDAAVRGQGLGTRLIRAVAAGIRARGEIPFLHAAATNTNAIRLYESLGFVLRRKLTFRAVRVPMSG